MENHYDNLKVNTEEKLLWFAGSELICWTETLRMVFRIERGRLVGGGKRLDQSKCNSKHVQMMKIQVYL